METMIFSVLSSGSKGNAIYVASGSTRLLIDNGLSFKELTKRMGSIGVPVDSLTAIVVSHDHGDHCAGVGVLDRKLDGVPVWITQETYHSFQRKNGNLSDPRIFESDGLLVLGGIVVMSYSVLHDAVDPVCFTLTDAVSKLGIVTDTGCIQDDLREGLAGCTGLVIETNYCTRLIESSSYHEKVLDRVKSDYGHLSNHDAFRLVDDVMHDGMEVVVACHVSEENNTYDLVEACAHVVIPERVRFMVSEQGEATELVALGGSDG